MEKELKPYMMSLYEYLGYAAGSELGKEVAATAVALKETIQEQYVSNLFRLKTDQFFRF